MNKKISSGFALLIILALAAFIFIAVKNSCNKDDYENISVNSIKKNETEKNSCSKHAYDGSAKIKVWASEKEDIVQVAKEDVGKLPIKETEQAKLKLVDVPETLANKIKQASEKKPVEITIKGIYLDCNNIPSASFDSGEVVFKKYLSKI